MENTLSPSDVRQLLLISITDKIAASVAFLSALATVATRDGVARAWMCLGAFALLHMVVSALQTERGFAPRLVVSVGSDLLIAATLVAADVGHLALTALAVHYVLSYSRIALYRALLPKMGGRTA